MLLLASQSPRRQELLRQIGIDYQVISAAIDETPRLHEAPLAYVQRIARDEAQAAQMQHDATQYPILTADTTVTFQDMILGKPKDYADFERMMTALSGNTHQVLSAIALRWQDQLIEKISISHVTFAPLPEHFIESYWQTGEPCDKAGGYAVQGIMARYIQKIEGSYSGIMGLPLFELSEALDNIGYNIG